MVGSNLVQQLQAHTYPTYYCECTYLQYQPSQSDGGLRTDVRQLSNEDTSCCQLIEKEGPLRVAILHHGHLYLYGLK